MNEEEAKYHPRLMLLDEFDGKIEGSLKYHKSLFEYRNEVADEESWGFVAWERGPMDPGFSSVMDSYETLDMIERDEEGQTHVYLVKEKGRRFVRGIQKGLDKLTGEDTAERREAAEKITTLNKGRSGYEIVQDEEVQEAKESPYQTDV